MATSDSITLIYICHQINEWFVATVSSEDADLANLKWHVNASPSRYALTTQKINGKKMQISMHRIVLSRILNRDLLPSEQVDHINGQCLDNRRENLRLATRAQNQQNRKIPSHNKTGFKGVRESKGRFIAIIGANGKTYYLGIFDTAELAAEAYDKAAIELHGEFARTNAIIKSQQNK